MHSKHDCTLANWRGQVDSTFACQAASLRSLDQILLLPKLGYTIAALYCLHEGCLEGRPAGYTLIQCTALSVEKAGVAPDITLRFTTRKQISVQAREPPWLWNPWVGSHKVQNGGNQWPHKMDLGPTKIKKKNHDCALYLVELKTEAIKLGYGRVLFSICKI